MDSHDEKLREILDDYRLERYPSSKEAIADINALWEQVAWDVDLQQDDGHWTRHPYQTPCRQESTAEARKRRIEKFGKTSRIRPLYARSNPDE